MTKLPKQWVHWVRSAGLRPAAITYSRKHSNRYFKKIDDYRYLKGKGYYWRGVEEGLQIGDCNSEFVRWCFCPRIIADLPKSKQDFIDTVNKLIAEKIQYEENKDEE